MDFGEVVAEWSCCALCKARESRVRELILDRTTCSNINENCCGGMRGACGLPVSGV